MNGRPRWGCPSASTPSHGQAHASRVRTAVGRVVARTLFICSILATGNAAAQSNLPVPKTEDDEWKEMGTTPPPYPVSAALVRFPTSWTTHEVLIDTATINIAADSIVRYTLVIKTSGGAENVSYEGLRCETGERRAYAFGRRDGTWAVARNSVWRPIVDTRANRHYFEFWRDLFCDGKVTEPRADILRNLLRGGRERPASIPSD